MTPESKRAFFDNQLRKIEQYGFSTVSVVGKSCAFSYTVGLHKSYRHPEIIVFGLPPQTAHGVLSDIASKAKNGEQLNFNEPTTELFGDCVTYFVEVPKSVFPEYVLSAVRLYGTEQFSVVQVVWPSAIDGLFPWDPDADPEFVALQPILGDPDFPAIRPS